MLSGMVAADPDQGGAAWAVLQYALGLRRLGHEVVFVEQLPAQSRSAASSLEDTRSGAYFRAVMEGAGLTQDAALLVEGTEETLGLSYDELVGRAVEADLLLNISGILTDKRILEAIAERAYLDLDPAFNQLWQAQGIDMRFDGHTRFVTVGQAIGTPRSPIPTLGREWIKTLPPVVLEQWPLQTDPGEAWTTIGNWRGYGSVEQEGVHYGQKAHSMRRYIDLPQRVEARFLLALNIDPGETPDVSALARHEWPLAHPADVAGTPDAYRRFVQSSRGELGVTKSGYVLSRSGWFSDRSACYLASGRPVVAQETGWSDYLPAGEGLLSFTDAASAADAIKQVESEYERHAAAARALAEEDLDSDKVLSRLLDRLLA